MNKDVMDFLNLKNMDQLDKKTKPQFTYQIDPYGYYSTEYIGHPLKIDGPEVIYKINSDGYRTKHFAPFDNSKETILFAGCSYTFGEGLPNKYTWPYLVSENFENVEYYNIGYMGMSINHIIKNVYSFIRSYGKPKNLFICFPDLGRNIYYSERMKSYIKVSIGAGAIASGDKDIKKYNLDFISENNLLLATTQISALEDYCSEAGINFIWTTWQENDYLIYKNIEFKFLIDPENIKLISTEYSNNENLPYWEFAKDGAHQGVSLTKNISRVFIEEIKRRDEKKD